MKLRFLAVAFGAGLAGCAAQAANAPEFTGQWTQGGVIVGRVAPGSQVSLDGKPLKVRADGSFLLGLPREAAARAKLEIKDPDGTLAHRYEFDVTKREYDIQRLDGLPPDKVTPPKEALPRIERDMAMSKAARLRDTDRGDFAQRFIWPCQGRISGVYGSQRILNGTPKAPHYGVDIAVPTGTKIHAPAGGVVSVAVPDMYYSGGTLMLDHGLGLTSTFMHLSKLLVKEGDEVKQGQLIAESGMTGRVTGPHLHWGVTWFDVRVDAQLLTGPMPPAGK